METQEIQYELGQKNSFEKPDEITKKLTRHPTLAYVPKKIESLNQEQQKTAYQIAKIMNTLPGIGTRPKIAEATESIVKTEGSNVLAAKALVNNNNEIYSLEITMKGTFAILTISIDNQKNTTTILLTDKKGDLIEGFYNKSKV